MGSKKHKKESKKKKHRSRSRSPLEGEERERRRHHKKHKDRKKDRSPDVEEVPVDSHLQLPAGSKDVEPRSRSSSEEAERERRLRDERHKRRDAPPPSASYSGERSVSPSGSGGGSGARAATSSSGNQESLSIEETNRIRVKLGLKPLETAERPPAEDGKLKDDLGEFYHVPATNIALQKKTDKIRERLQEHKEKRKLEQKLQTTLLAEESDGEDDPTAWIKKSREIEKQKKEAAKRAALLDEMDLAFGVSALVAQEERSDRERSYTTRQLKGLRVAHDYDALGSERDVVLTLADKEVLAEDNEDVLVNVNLLDTEKYNKNIEERKKAKAGYKAYDDEADLEAAALGLQKAVLAKYDDEIDKSKAAKERGFVIGDEDGLEARRFRQMMMRERMQGNAEKRLESLMLPELRIASDYYDEHEMQAKFKKPKKKGKIRKRPKHEPIDVDEYDPAAALLETDDTEVKPELLKSALAVDEDELEPDSELQIALARARRLRQVEATTHIPKVEEILDRVKEEDEQPEAGGSTIMLDATAEFCRTLGDIPTYGQAGNRDHRAEILDFEREEMELDQQTEGGEGGAGGAWSRVDVHNEQPPDIAAGSSIALDAEPSLGAGVAGALQLALSKGYLEKAATAPAPRSQHKALIAAINYSIEDKTYGEDDKHGRRERGGYSGPLQDFREKSHFKPNIKLEYVDDDGRALCPKEAFRYLSHKFHGKGPGKNKQEKRIKKAVQEGLMKKMSSTDTPLNTLALLQEKQKETHSPYVLLSGAKRDQNN